MVLTNTSKILINYYNKLNISFERRKNIDFLHKKIFNILENENIQNIRNELINNENKKIIKSNLLKHFINNLYVTDEIKSYIKEKKEEILYYNIKFNNTYIKIYFFIYEKGDKYEMYDKISKNMVMVINLIVKLMKKEVEDMVCSKDGLNIYVLLTPFKRMINKKEILSAVHTNGGFSYGCRNRGDIIVYRREDYFKVFIHELIHNFGYDGYLFKSRKVYEKINNNFNLRNMDLSIYEGLTEFWAVIINVSFLSFCMNKKNINKYVLCFNKLINYEIIHGLFQSNKILQNYDLDYNKLLYDRNESKYDENTHIFSYYIIKTLLLFSYDNLLNKKIIINDKLIFERTEENINRYIDYIIKISHKKKLNKYFDYIKYKYDLLIEKSKKVNEKEKYKIEMVIKNSKLIVIEYDYT